METAMPVDATAAALAAEVGAARQALIDFVERESRDCWPAHELKARARNGWSAGAMSLALNRLLEDGTFELKDGDCICMAA